MTAGERYGITPYGTEAMHVLRAEKGYIIVGQETDGSVTPTDLGMDWIVSKAKDFVGRRSLTRADMASPERKRTEEHKPELQSLMRNAYAVFCLKKKKSPPQNTR